MKLEGTTDIFPLRELIEMVTYSTVTGALNIYGSTGAGSIFFRDGRMTHVLCGDLTGLDALTELFIQHGANFTFVSDTRCDEETVWGDAHFLLNNAEQMAARWHVVRPLVPSLDLVPRLAVASESHSRRLLPTQTMLLQAIDGHANLRELSTRLSWSTIDVCEVVIELMQAGLVELSGRGGGGPASPDRTSASQGRARPGLFDRIVNASAATA